MREDSLKKGQCGCTLDGVTLPHRIAEPKVSTIVNHEDTELAIMKGAAFLELSLEEVKLILPQMELFLKLYSK